MSEKKVRNSSIELIKIVAIIIIILSHSMPDGDSTMPASHIDIDYATTNIHLIIAQIFKNYGNLGNVIFIFASSWFLIDSKKAHIRKISDCLADNFFVSISWMIIFVLLGYDLGAKVIFKQFFPFTFSNCWFITCFLIFYAIHPLLSYAIDNITKEQLLAFNFVYFVLYNLISFAVGATYFFYSDLIGFIGIFFMAAYIKKYMQKTFSNIKINIIMILVGIVLETIVLIVTSIGASYVSVLVGKMDYWDNYINPCMLIIGIGMFNIAYNKTFYNKTINYISSLSLLIYVIHANILIRQYGRYDLFAWIKEKFGYDMLTFWIVAYAIVNFFGSIIIATIYDKSIRKYVHRVFGKISDLCVNVYTNTVGNILKLS